MDIHLFGKNALVCGSSKGIGKAAAIELAELGASITLVSRSAEKMSDVIKDMKMGPTQDHDFLVVDYTHGEELKRKVYALTVQRNYHILVNNTGGPPGGAIKDASTDEFERAFHNHLICNHILAAALRKGMVKEGYGRIINIISTSVREPIDNLGVSNTIRGAVASWSKTMANELGPLGITVNNVLPGFTDTERLAEVLGDRAKELDKPYEEVVEQVKKQIPLQRLADPREIGSVVAFLASPAASYVNGINMIVDGGRTRSI
jgi:3-oxoacyl-[acyl-carrier protein] reductase